MEQRNIKSIEIQDYDYELKEERIAKYPLEERDQSKLLCYKEGQIDSHKFLDLVNLIPQGAMLIRNNSKVIHARLLFQKVTGARVEIFCLEPLNPNSYELILSSKESCLWTCMLGNAHRWHEEQILEREIDAEGGRVKLSAQRIAKNQVKFFWDNSNYSFGELLELMGVLPIPPYLNRETEERDKFCYQTVYAQAEGSVAAPTAGLHFTPKVFSLLEDASCTVLDVTLHVGAGTFRPVKSEQIGDHEMHRELIEISDVTIKALRTKLECIIAVGTTSVRTLESLYWFALMLSKNMIKEQELNTIPQWIAYEESPSLSSVEAIDLILNYMARQHLSKLIFSTEILIVPSYKFQIVKGIITNFHQPHSTLLLLIAAFIGDDWRTVYNYALDHDYRFLSYGDSSLLYPRI